jgi:5-dehydro-2-deoxygluconokinase
VALISGVGDDLLADYLVEFLTVEGVDTTGVRLIPGHNTSLCLSEVSPPERFPQVFYRANPADLQLVLQDSDRALIKQSQMFVTNGTSLASSPSRESTLEALRTARDARLRTIFDVDYRSSSWKSPAEAGRVARGILEWVDVVLGNEEEFGLLSETADADRQLATVLDHGPKLVIRKLGARGVEVRTRSESHAAPPHPMPVVCAIGGGDGFATGFLYGLYKRCTLKQCLQYGNAAAAIVVSRVSCADSMPRLAELEERMCTDAGDRSEAQVGRT